MPTIAALRARSPQLFLVAVCFGVLWWTVFALNAAMYPNEAERRLGIIPTWDGNPERWNDFAEEVALWSLGETMEVSLPLAW